MKYRLPSTRRRFYKNHHGKAVVDIDIEQRVEPLLPIVKVAPKGLPNRLLDVGCGDGSIGRRLARILGDFELFGVDISETAVQEAKRRGYTAYVIDLENERLPFADCTFGFVFCGEIIEHLFNTDLLLLEVNRVLTPGGVVLLTTPNLAWWINRLVLLLGYQPYFSEVSAVHNVGKFWGSDAKVPVGGHLRLFTSTALVRLMETYGFTQIKVFGVHAGSRNLPIFLRTIDKLLSRRPTLAPTLAVLARRALKTREKDIKS